MYGTQHTWYLRWKLFARAGRMGYNVMNVDGDFVFYREFYSVAKAPPMNSINVRRRRGRVARLQPSARAAGGRRC